MSFLILLFFSFNLFNFIANLATIQFKTFYPRRSNTKQDINQFNTQDFVESIVLSKIYFELISGNETIEKNYKTQKLNIFTNTVYQSYFKSYEFFDIPEENKLFCNYSRLLSDTYKNINPEKNIAEESFKIFTDINLSENKYITLKFYEEKSDKDEEFLCGLIGIDGSIFKLDDTNFLPQIVQKINASNKAFIIKYSNITSDEGQIIIGDMPHNYLSNEYNESNLINFKSGNDKWSITMDSLILEGYNISSSDIYEDIEVCLSFEYDGLVFSEIYFEYLNKIFFNKYYEKDICKNETIFVYNKAYYIISCNAGYFGKDDIKKFPKITFIRYRSNLNFTFESDELFYLRDNRYYLKIYKISHKTKVFELGRNFLKKYLTVFDFDKKQISFYKKEDKKNDNEEPDNLWKILLIVFLSAILIFLVLGIFIGKKIYQSRKKRANELADDNYLYDPNINDENGKEKLFNEENKE